MKHQVFNPYLPLGTCIPDGEPHVFGDRLYIFGSHETDGGNKFCDQDYEVFSAPVDDLSAWRSDGVSYRAEQDPDYGKNGATCMYAPDVAQGPDGRFYLYYALSGGSNFTEPMHVAVADAPAGPYEYYGEVKNADGSTFDRYVTFDPGMLVDDDGSVWLYYGWALADERIASAGPAEREGLRAQMPQVEQMFFQKTPEQLERDGGSCQGGYVVRLAPDMLTVASEPAPTAPGQMDAFGTCFEGHAFFEASSMRKVAGRYCFIYSSEHQHELCYAVGEKPDGPFEYAGVLVSNGDIGIDGREKADRLAMTGNDHGSLVEVAGQWYIFYHKPLNKTTFSRVGCAEPITIAEDGSIAQVPMTSCGLNGGPLACEGSYPAAIACNLTNGHMPHVGPQGVEGTMPYVATKDGEHVIADFGDGCMAGYKYFAFAGATTLAVELCGDARGTLSASTEEGLLAAAEVVPADAWTTVELPVDVTGTHVLYLRFTGEGFLAIKQLTWL